MLAWASARASFCLMTNGPDWKVLTSQVPPRKIGKDLRAVVLRSQQQFRWGLVIGTALCAVMFAVFFPWRIGDELLLNFAGVPGRATVTNALYADRTVGDNIVMRKRRLFVVQFKFRDASGRAFNSYSFHDGPLPPDTSADIVYLAQRPRLARLKDGTLVPGGVLEVVFGLIFLALPLIGLWNYRRWRSNRLRLLSHGVYVSGSIERVWRDDPKKDQRGWIDLKYQSPIGSIRQTLMVEEDVLERARKIIEAGSVVGIFYAEQSPRNHIVLEFVA